MVFRKRPMARQRKSVASAWIVSILLAAVLITLGIGVVVRLLRHRQDGPKLIDADGVTYIACGGAIWMRDEGNMKDPATMTYEVLFKDAQGADHHLTMVRVLKITDLPNDTPACKTSLPLSSGAEAR
jgi:hypothetical protein